MASTSVELEMATSIEDVERILEELLAQEAAIDAKLETLLDPSNQPDVTPLASLQSSLDIQDQIQQLNDRIGPAAETAHGLSERVKKLDIEQARVKESLKYVEDVQDLKVLRPLLVCLELTCRAVFWVFMRQWNDRTGMMQLRFFIKPRYWTRR